jgi:hypothetical protein
MMTDEEIRQIAIGVLGCEAQLGQALETYQAIQELVEKNTPVVSALAAARGPLRKALEALQEVEKFGPVEMLATKVLVDALVGADRIQAMLDAIAPLRGALTAVQRVRHEFRGVSHS